WQLFSSGNSFALTVGKCTSSGNSAMGMLLHLQWENVLAVGSSSLAVGMTWSILF
nr:hypothetical protein [Tanacetum cinerariifolium]